MTESVPWEGQCIDATNQFAARCSELKKQNPYSETDTMKYIADALVTDLLDRFFSQTEIRSAFESALANLPKYAAGEERRGDKR